MEIPLVNPANGRSQPVSWRTVAGLALALFFALAPLARWVAPGTGVHSLLAREAVWWACAAVILIWLKWSERLPLSSIGMRRFTWKSLAFAVAAAVAIVAAMTLHYAVIVPFFHLNATVGIAAEQKILSTPYWYRVLIVVRAAVVEEILFRGYLIEKVRQLTKSTSVAILVSVAAFTYAHLAGWGWVHLFPVAASGLILALLYAWRRDLPCNMVGHFLADALGFLTR